MIQNPNTQAELDAMKAELDALPKDSPEREEAQAAAWSGLLLAELVMPLFLVGMYYLLRAGFGVRSLGVEIGLYYVTMAAGFWLARRVSESGRLAYLSGVLVILTGLLGAALILFTLAPPELPIFVAEP